MIRNARTDEIDAIIAITRACAAHMTAAGILQWNDHYPNREAFWRDIQRQELYVLVEAGQLIGCIAISSVKDKEYEQVEWLTRDGNNLYIHRLAVHPDYQSRGFARKLMDHAEQLALRKKAVSIRLDTFSRNKRNQRFYEARGYTRLGDVYFPMQSEHPFHCYELPLAPHRTSEK